MRTVGRLVGATLASGSVVMAFVSGCHGDHGTAATGSGGFAASSGNGTGGDAPLSSSATSGSGGGVTSSSSATSGGGGSPFPNCADPHAPWSNLEGCGWPGPKNTGPDLSKCPGGLKMMGSSSMPMPVINVSQAGAMISCAEVFGQLHITAPNVTIVNSIVHYDSGMTGTNANGTATIVVDDGANATIDHVESDGMNGVHACIWHQGTSLTARYLNCHNIDDGIFSWADTGFSPTTGDNFTIEESYFHDFTMLTSNGHIDGYQTEGSSHGVIHHNTYDMTTDADSAIAIWDSLKDSTDITVDHNLMAGGGATIYAEDYDPSDMGPQGGFSVTNIVFKNNVFSNHLSPCVGAYFVWFSRPTFPYQGGPTDGWHRTGNIVLETGENIDSDNPHPAGGPACN
jgi:hypothetical protein